jgi:hypothetical protein
MNILERLALRLTRAIPLPESLHPFLRESRAKSADNGASAKAIDYSFNHTP